MPRTSLPTDSGLYATPRQVRWLIAAAVCAALLLGEEVAHYAVATDLGVTDAIAASALVHPQCRETDSRYDLVCPMPGYNSVALQCMGVTCGVRNPNVPPATDKSRAENLVMDHDDVLASLRVEQPYNAGNHEWRQHVAELEAGKVPAPQRRNLDRPPATPEEAWKIVQGRDLRSLHIVAATWLKQHDG